MPERTNYLNDLKDKLLPSESKVLELKYSGKTFGKMEDNERWFAAQTILLKIHAIKGWTIPVSEMMDILVDQFQQKLNEGYQNVTVAEMEYAFRNSTDVKDWGKAMNLSLIDEVMQPYLENRFDLSQQEEKLKKPIMIEAPQPMTKEEKAEWIMEWKEKVDNVNFELIPLIFYDFMDEDDLLRLSNKQKWEYTEKAQQAVKSQLQIAIGECKTTDALREYGNFEKMEKEGFTGELKGRILNRAKRLIIYDYLKGIIE